jgi:Tfp pilus assembly protein PilX
MRVAQRGFVLLPVFAFVLALALLGYAASRSGSNASAVLARAQHAATARYAAEAALAHATWRAQRSDCKAYVPVTTTSFGAASYAASYSVPAGSPVTVTGTALLDDGTTASASNTIDVYQLPVLLESQYDSAAADTGLDSKSGKDYSAEKTLIVKKQAGEERRALFGIDVSTVPAGARVLSARLGLYAEKADVNPGAQLSVHALTRAWSERHATWTAYDVLLVLPEPWTTPGGDYVAEPVSVVVPDQTKTWTWFDLTLLVQDWLAGRAPNHGVLLKANDKVKDFEFRTSDEDPPAKRPKVIVEYACPCGSVCAPIVPPGTTLLLSTLQNSTLAGVSVKDGDLVRLDPLAARATIELPEDGTYGSDVNLDAIHAYNDGRLLLSTAGAANLAGLAFQDEDIVEYNKANKTATLVFDGSARFAQDEDVDAVHGYDTGQFMISTETAATLAGLAFEDEDLVEYDPIGNTATLIFDGSAHFAANENIDAVQMLGDGRILLSTDSDATLAGLNFTDADIALYDPLKNTAVIAFDGSGIGGASDTDLDAFHDERPYPLVNQLRLEPIADTYIASAQPDNAFGAGRVLRVGNAMRTLLQFDFAALPVGATVTSATLHLNMDAGGAALLTGAYQVTAPWAEGTATWNNTGGGSVGLLPIATATFAASPALWTKWVLPPALIHEWRDGVKANYGLLLKPTLVALGTSHVRSRNHGSTAARPRLLLEYTLP